MPNKPPKYKPFGTLKPSLKRTFQQRQSVDRELRQPYYQSYRWRKLRGELKVSQRAADQQLIDGLIAKGVVSWAQVQDFLEDKRSQALCSSCLKKERYQPAEVLDHVIPFREGAGLDFYDPDNLQWLCHKCHARKSGSESKK